MRRWEMRRVNHQWLIGCFDMRSEWQTVACVLGRAEADAILDAIIVREGVLPTEEAIARQREIFEPEL